MKRSPRLLITLITILCCLSAGISSARKGKGVINADEKNTFYSDANLGTVTSTVTSTVTHKYLFDGWNLIAEFNDDPDADHTSRFYTWSPELGGHGALLSIHIDGNTYVPVYDAQSNIIALCDATGKQIAHWERGPFGELLKHSGRTHLCPFGFATQYTDAETGLVYFGHRHYDPVTGRWLSQEPLGEGESFNLYSYCHNDPIHKVDILGLAEAWLHYHSSQIGYAKFLEYSVKLALASEDENVSESFLESYEKWALDGYDLYVSELIAAKAAVASEQKYAWRTDWLQHASLNKLLDQIHSHGVNSKVYTKNNSEEILAIGAQLSNQFSEQRQFGELVAKSVKGVETGGNGLLLATGVGGFVVNGSKILATEGLKRGSVILAKQLAIAGGTNYALSEGADFAVANGYITEDQLRLVDVGINLITARILIKNGVKATDVVTPKTAGPLSATDANTPHLLRGKRPPYAAGTRARDIVLDKPRAFVRVHGLDNQERSWMMRADEINGLSPAQIRDKFALPDLPTHISDVLVPAGTRIRVGTAGAQEDWGAGGGIQYELLQRLSEDAFRNMRRLE